MFVNWFYLQSLTFFISLSRESVSEHLCAQSIKLTSNTAASGLYHQLESELVGSHLLSLIDFYANIVLIYYQRINYFFLLNDYYIFFVNIRYESKCNARRLPFLKRTPITYHVIKFSIYFRKVYISFPSLLLLSIKRCSLRLIWFFVCAYAHSSWKEKAFWLGAPLRGLYKNCLILLLFFILSFLFIII